MSSIHQQIAKQFYSVAKNGVMGYYDELNELQWLSKEELAALQRRHLQDLLEYVNVHVPYYRDLFKQVGFHPSDFAADPATFSKIPLLTKEIVRQNHDRLTTTEEDRRRSLIPTKTGGTTGEPLWLMQEPDYRDFNAAQYYHKMSWSGWQLGQPQAWLWGHAVVGAGSQATPVTRAKDWLANRIRSNAFHMTEESMEKLASQLEKHPGGVLWSYASTLYRFAQFLQQRGHHIEVCGAYAGAEPVYEHQRQLIEETLGCGVFSSYSCIEIGSIACECEQHDGLHMSTRTCFLEVLRDGEPVPDGEGGEFVLTSLTHYGFPIIRYKLEDWGRKSTRQCSCGRGLPMLEIVDGRILDQFKTKDGRLVNAWVVIPMVPLLGPIKQFQVVQKTVDLVVFRVIKAGPIDEEKFKEIQEALRAVLGDNVEARLEFVDSLPSSPTGKHRFAVSEVN